MSLDVRAIFIRPPPPLLLFDDDDEEEEAKESEEEEAEVLEVRDDDDDDDVGTRVLDSFSSVSVCGRLTTMALSWDWAR